MRWKSKRRVTPREAAQATAGSIPRQRKIFPQLQPDLLAGFQREVTNSRPTAIAGNNETRECSANNAGRAARAASDQTAGNGSDTHVQDVAAVTFRGCGA